MNRPPPNSAHPEASAPSGALEAPQAISLRRLCDLLVACDVVYDEAVTDPEGYDGGVTLDRIGRLHNALTNSFSSGALEAQVPSAASEEASVTKFEAIWLDELDEEDGPYCVCDLEPTIDESDWGVCDCCGKPLS